MRSFNRSVAPWGLGAVLLATLTGCPKHVDVEAAAKPAPQSELPAAVPGEQLAIQWGGALAGDARRFADAYSRAVWVQTQLAAGAYDQVAPDLTQIRNDLNAIKNNPDLPADLKAKLNAVMPIASTLMRVAKAHEATALQLASGLVSGMLALASSPDTVAWLGAQGGGGGPATGAVAPGEQLQLGWGTVLGTEGRQYAEAYARLALAQTRLAAGDWNGAVIDLRASLGMLDALNKRQDLPPSLKAQISDLMTRVPTLANQLSARDPQAIAAIGQLVGTMNRITLDPAIVAWLK